MNNPVKAGKLLKAILALAAAVLFFTASALADTYTFAALPGPGTTHTAPGSTVGWGYSITNNSTTKWLVITGLDASTSAFITSNPYFFDFPSIAPGASRIVPYNPFSPYGYSFLAANGYAHQVKNTPFDPVTNPLNALGLYQAKISAYAPLGTVINQSFTLDAVWVTGDVDTDLSAQFVGTAPTNTTASRSVVTPEPASLTLVGMGIFGLAFGAKKKKPTTLP